MFARFALLHATALATHGRTPEALLIYDNLSLVFDQYGDPIERGLLQMRRARALQAVGQNEEAVQAVSQGILCWATDPSPRFAHPLLALLAAWADQEVSWEVAEVVAGGPILLQYMTPENCPALVSVLSDLVEPENLSRFHRQFSHLNAAARSNLTLSFSHLVLGHATALVTVGRAREALPVLDSLSPVLDRYGGPRDRGLLQFRRAQALQAVGRNEEAVEAAGQGVVVWATSPISPPTHPLLTLLVGWAYKELSWEIAQAAAGGPILLQYMTPENCPALVSVLSDLVEAEDCAWLTAILNGLGTGTPGSFAVLLSHFALVHAGALVERGRTGEAFLILGGLAPLLGRHGGPVECGVLHILRARALERAGRFEEATHAASQGIAVLEGVESSRVAQPLAAKCLYFRARAFKELRRFEEALVDLNRAESIYASCRYNNTAAIVQLERAVVYRWCNRHEDALAEIDRAERNLAADPSAACPTEMELRAGMEVHPEGQLHLERGLCLVETGRLSEALVHFDRAEGIVAGQSVNVALTRMHRALALLKMGHYDPYAMTDLAFAEETFRSWGRPVETAWCHDAIGALCMVARRYEDAHAAYTSAMNILEGQHCASEAAQCRMRRAGAAAGLRRFEEAMADVTLAEQVLGVLGQPTAARSNKAMILALSGRHEEALAEYEREDTSMLAGEALSIHHSNLGITLLHLGRFQEALERLTHARAAMRVGRRVAGLDETNLEALLPWKNILPLAVSLALTLEQPTLAFAAVQDSKAGTLADLLGVTDSLCEGDDLQGERTRVVRWLLSGREQRVEAEVRKRLAREQEPATEERRWLTRQAVEEDAGLKSELQRDTVALARALGRARRSAPDGAAAWNGLTTDLSPDVIRAALPRDWALLDFWVDSAERTHVFFLTEADLEVVTLTLPVTSPEMQHALRDLASWFRLPPIGGRDAVLDFFDDVLLSPLRPRLRGLKGLYLVPHHFLHFVPFHACRDEDGQPLEEEFQVSYLPSAALLPRLAPPLPHSQLQRHMLSLANPERGTSRTLPFAEWETYHLREALGLPRHDVWSGPDATRSKARDWDTATVVHFGCHGVNHPEFAPISHLRLHDDLLLAHDILHGQPPLPAGSLALLNGCETAGRDMRDVDEGFGLVTAFLLRGAGLALATQWNVDDLAAAELGISFLTGVLRDGLPPTEALRDARKKLLKITLEDQEARCQELLKQRFPPAEFPVEAAKIASRAMRGCVERGSRAGGLHYAKIATDALRSAGPRGAAEQVEMDRECYERQAATSADGHTLAYAHPAQWSAFQLIGRVT